MGRGDGVYTGQFPQLRHNQFKRGRMGGKPDLFIAILDSVIWLAVLAAFIFLALTFKNRKLLRSIAIVLATTIVGMQFTAYGIQLAPKIIDNSSPVEEKLTGLTIKNIREVSENKNIIIFVIDRFDASYYYDLKEKEPGFFSRLDGFTYYNDYISLYARTYPAITSMVTGIDNDFKTTRGQLFRLCLQQFKVFKGSESK
jgi:hypothetical protein